MIHSENPSIANHQDGAPAAATEPSARHNGGGEAEGIHLIIIGAGLAGLSAALSTKLANPNHQVTILETVKELQEVGVSRQNLKKRTSFKKNHAGIELLTKYIPRFQRPVSK